MASEQYCWLTERILLLFYIGWRTWTFIHICFVLLRLYPWLTLLKRNKLLTLSLTLTLKLTLNWCYQQVFLKFKQWQPEWKCPRNVQRNVWFHYLRARQTETLLPQAPPIEPLLSARCSMCASFCSLTCTLHRFSRGHGHLLINDGRWRHVPVWHHTGDRVSAAARRVLQGVASHHRARHLSYCLRRRTDRKLPGARCLQPANDDHFIQRPAGYHGRQRHRQASQRPALLFPRFFTRH